MPTVVGIDEAGYGPLLGPLVVGATVWEVDAAQVGTNWWKCLRPAVCRTQSKREYRVCVNDSKKVFDQKKGIPSLERSVLAFARLAGIHCETAGELIAALTVDVPGPPKSARAPAAVQGPALTAPHPWYQTLERRVPCDETRMPSEPMAAKLSRTLEQAGIRCCGMAVEVIPESLFNQRMRQTRNKAAINLELVLKLVARAIRAAPDPEIHFFVDRLGGRTDYQPALQAAFPDRELAILEAREFTSRYRLASSNGRVAAPSAGPRTDGSAMSHSRTSGSLVSHMDRGRQGDWTFTFQVEADDSFMPVALASMTCKYVRELVMHEFNRYWAAFDPSLRPTAGYYGDARRFMRDINPWVARAGLHADDFVRVC